MSRAFARLNTRHASQIDLESSHDLPTFDPAAADTIAPTMIGTFDRQESDDEMQRGVTVLGKARQEFEALRPLPSPLPGSVLAIEGPRHTAFEQIDTIVSRHRAQCTDNLERVFQLMVDDANEQVLSYPYSLYSLIRSAVESAALALWVLAPETKAKRVMRCLRLTYRDTADVYHFTATVTPERALGPHRARRDKIVRRLEELKDTVGSLKQKPLTGPPKYTEILKEASERTGKPGAYIYAIDSPLVIWKASSAFIHGSGQMISSLSDFKQITEFEGGVAQAEITPSIQMLASSTLIVVRLLARVDARFAYLATHDHSKRPITT